MAVYRWIYANADLAGDRGDYFVRLCDPALLPYKDKLIRLSNRLLCVEARQGERTARQCWAAGFLDRGRTIYFVAVGTEQGSLLGGEISAAGRFFCVLAYGLTGADIRICERDTALFAPLIEKLRDLGKRELSLTCDEIRPAPGKTDAAEGPLEGTREKYNILKSTPQANARCWAESMERPAALDLFRIEDAARLISMMPDMVVTVTDTAGDFWWQPGSRLKEGKRTGEAGSSLSDGENPPNEKKGRKILTEERQDAVRRMIGSSAAKRCLAGNNAAKLSEKENAKIRKAQMEAQKSGKIRKLQKQGEVRQKRGNASEKVRADALLMERVRRCWMELPDEEKRWIEKVCAKMEKKDLAGYFLNFACLYLWMCGNGRQEQAGKLIDRTVKEAGGYAGLYYGYKVENGQDLVRLGRFWKASTQEKETVMTKLNRLLADAVGR